VDDVLLVRELHGVAGIRHGIVQVAAGFHGFNPNADIRTAKTAKFREKIRIHEAVSLPSFG